MKKIFFVLTVFTLTQSMAFSQVMTVKERLRLSLWTEGLSEKPNPSVKAEPEKAPLPEELERAIEKI